jgi:hypothetical protein
VQTRAGEDRNLRSELVGVGRQQEQEHHEREQEEHQQVRIISPELAYV